MRNNLRLARKQKKFSQLKVAQIIGITMRMYQYIEAGQREGKGWIWDALQDLFKVDQRELRAVTEDKVQAS